MFSVHRKQKTPPPPKRDEGSRGTTLIQKNRSSFLRLLNAETRRGFPRRLGGSTRAAPESSHQPLSLCKVRKRSFPSTPYINIIPLYRQNVNTLLKFHTPTLTPGNAA